MCVVCACVWCVRVCICDSKLLSKLDSVLFSKLDSILFSKLDSILFSKLDRVNSTYHMSSDVEYSVDPMSTSGGRYHNVTTS